MADTVDPQPPPPPPPAQEPPPEVTVTQPAIVTPIPGEAPPPREGCMAKRSCLEKCLLFFVIIILIIVIIAVAFFLVYYFFSKPPEGTCLTDSCVQSASRLKSFMNDEVDPCNNFYQYACGGWMASKVLDPTEDMLDTTSILRDGYRIKMKGLLETPIGLDDPPYKTEPRNFYKACNNVARMDERGTGPFMEFIESVGKFPILDPTWNETDFDLDEMIVALAKLGVTPLFSLHVDKDWMKPEKNRLYIGDAELSLKHKTSYQKGSNGIKMREDYLVDVLSMLGKFTDEEKDEIRADVKEILELETQIAKSMRDPVEKKGRKPEYTLIHTLNVEHKYLDWRRDLIQIAMGSAEIQGEDNIFVLEERYLEKLGEILNNVDERVLANYLMSNLLEFTSWLGQEFQDRKAQYLKMVEDKSGMVRWEKCIKLTTEIYPMFVSRLFVDKFFTGQAKKEIDTMVSDLTRAFNGMLTRNNWMKIETKLKAQTKLERMEKKVGYPDVITDDEELNKFYTEIPADANNYMETIKAYQEFKVRETLKQLEVSPDRKKWIRTSPVSVDSGYEETENEIAFPAAFLQPPLYDPEYPSSMKYGAAGMWYGRDVVHGFDRDGSRYDETGALEPWWTDKDKEGFKAQSECFVDQYGCYKWEGNSIDGEITLVENLADNGGLEQSFKAYRAKIKRDGTEEQRLPGLDLNHNQIFFLSFAQSWCAKIRDSAKKSMVETGPHSPHPYRVYGALQNSQEFADAFKCPLGTRMNPMRKCKMW